MGNNLKFLREKRDWTIEEAARAFGMSRGGYVKLERGERRLTSNYIAKASEVFAVPEAAVLDESFDESLVEPLEAAEQSTPLNGGTKSLFTVVPIAGYVGAGASVYPVEGDTAGHGGYIKAPRGFGAMEALIVRGDSMAPAYENGDVIYFNGQPAELPIRETGKAYVVRLVDGRMLLKLVTPSGNGRYLLTSWNAPPIQDAEIESAFKVRYIRKP